MACINRVELEEGHILQIYIHQPTDEEHVYRVARSTINLNESIGNKDGCFEITKKGNFSLTSKEVRLEGEILHAQLATSKGEWVDDQILVEAALPEQGGVTMALRLLPQERRASWHDETGNQYLGYYEHSKEAKHLQWALDRFQDGIKFSPLGEPKRTQRLQSIGPRYRDLYERTNHAPDLEQSIQSLQSALELMIPTHDDDDDSHYSQTHAHLLQSLALRQGRHFDTTGDMRDLEKSIELYAACLEETPPGHTDRLERLRRLGERYYDRFEKRGGEEDAEMAIGLFREAEKEEEAEGGVGGRGAGKAGGGGHGHGHGCQRVRIIC